MGIHQSIQQACLGVHHLFFNQCSQKRWGPHKKNFQLIFECFGLISCFNKSDIHVARHVRAPIGVWQCHGEDYVGVECNFQNSMVLMWWWCGLAVLRHSKCCPHKYCYGTVQIKKGIMSVCCPLLWETTYIAIVIWCCYNMYKCTNLKNDKNTLLSH